MKPKAVFQNVGRVGRMVASRRARIAIPGLGSVLLAAVVIAGLSIAGAWRPFNDIFHDLWVAVLPSGGSRQQSVLLVEVDPANPPDWRRLADHLFAGGIAAVGFVIDLPAPALAALATSPHAARIVVGLPLVERSDDPDQRVTRPGAANVPAPLRAAVAAAPDRTGHLAQRQRYIWSELRPPLPSVEAVLAGKTTLAEDYRIHMHGGLDLPRLPAAQVVAAVTVRQLAEGRTALIGAASGPYQWQLHVPGPDGGRSLTQLEFHGLALDTLLRDRIVGEPNGWLVLAGLLIFGLVTYVALMPLPPQAGFLAGAGLLVGQMILAVLALVALDFALPLVESMLVTLVTLAVAFREKLAREGERLRRLTQSTFGKLSHRVLPPDFSESDGHWVHVINMVDQVLALNRTIFLERVEGDHRVKEIQALRCSITDINEMRRDYHRHPYTAAIERRGVYEVEGSRLYLKTLDVVERQFLVPLIYGGEVLGFWAIAILPEKIDDDARFVAVTERLAGQIAALLYQRAVWQERQSLEQSSWNRLLSDKLSRSVTRLGQSVTALEARLTGFENLFAGLASAAILYDMFGRVMLINRKMTTLLAAWQLAPYELRSVDMLTALTGQPADASREALRQLVFEGRELLTEVRPAHDRRQHLLLHLRALGTEEEEGSAAAAHGILLELIDIAQAHRDLRLRSDALHFVLERVAETVAGIAGESGVPAAVAERLAGAGRWVQRADVLMLPRASDRVPGVTALLPLPPLRRAAQAAAQQQQRATMHIAEPLPACLVYAHPEELERILIAALALLGDDALTDSRIDIAVDIVSQDAVCIRLVNQGFGLPAERLAALLAPGADFTVEPWHSLRRGQRIVGEWGGALEITSALGGGFRIALHLPGLT